MRLVSGEVDFLVMPTWADSFLSHDFEEAGISHAFFELHETAFEDGLVEQVVIHYPVN